LTFVIQTSSFRLARRRRSPLSEALRVAFLGSVAAVYLVLVGLLQTMADRWLVFPVVPVSHFILGTLAFAAAYVAARNATGFLGAAGFGGLTGLIMGFVLAGLTGFVAAVDIRDYIVTAGPPMIRLLSLDKGEAAALVGLPAAGLAVGFGAGAGSRLPSRLRNAVLIATIATVLVALLKDVLVSVLANFPGRLGNIFFGQTGLKVVPAIIVWLAALAASLAGPSVAVRLDAGPGSRDTTRVAVIAIGILLALSLPLVTNVFVAQVMIMVTLYTLMSIGLNIELGLAGLVDLGFVGFFAIGAYTVALLGSTDIYGLANLSFWITLPLAVVFSAIGGFLFGLPVLRVRGDYLAMATMGLGEIIRILVLSDALKPYLGASGGIGQVTRPVIAGYSLNSPISLYYLALILVAIVITISSRLQSSRFGRAWLALREDEDVAQALGVDPVATKLLAYTIGAAFAGAAGAVFAVLIGGVYPHSFQLLVSTNVLAILVIGGLGSVGGVICGALALIGLPELLREFGEYRYLVYGIAIIAMMYFRPGGIWQSRRGGALT
jgi:branched-chain amino acid transport system permease protein